jgi:hypothetical protein
MSWIGNNVTSDSVRIRKFENGGHGLQATKDLPVSSIFNLFILQYGISRI